MKPLSERDENTMDKLNYFMLIHGRRNEATL